MRWGAPEVALKCETNTSSPNEPHPHATSNPNTVGLVDASSFSAFVPTAKQEEFLTALLVAVKESDAVLAVPLFATHVDHRRCGLMKVCWGGRGGGGIRRER